MSFTYEDPVTKPGHQKTETITTHPAYAMIGASRVSGRMNLFASEFDHHAFVVVRIHAAELHRDLHRDWHHARNEYIEVAMSEAQWATFVSSPNVGFGVPCTLRARQGVDVPQLPDPPQRVEQFRGELQDTLKEALQEMQALREMLADAKVTEKLRKELLAKLNTAVQHLTANVPFVAKSFDEHLEETVEHAKVEVNAYVQMVLMRAGAQSLQAPIRLKTLGPGAVDGEVVEPERRCDQCGNVIPANRIACETCWP